MQFEQINNMLESYRLNQGRLAFLNTQISEMEMMLQTAKAELVSDEVLRSQGLDGMPHGNQISRTVEETAIRLADGWLPKEIVAIQDQLHRLIAEQETLKLQVAYVDALLTGLQDRPRWVIEHQLIAGESWREVVSGYRNRFGETVSKDTIKRLRGRAMADIEKIAVALQ